MGSLPQVYGKDPYLPLLHNKSRLVSSMKRLKQIAGSMQLQRSLTKSKSKNDMILKQRCPLLKSVCLVFPLQEE